eukprot:TRINITY_DN703_c0_g6_i5.p1 TRINITY_DN703_c0_g6~~TRINITY_DN703_c0_g6_i5.p1  ORF type:complete len:371 (-),score=95.25 TRINITY_DN703_c0_g6_i5:45-1157(-)
MGTIYQCCNRNGPIKEEEIKLSTYKQIKVQIGSYTIGLKTRLKELMAQCGVGGVIRKTVHVTPDSIHSTPVYTEVVAGGTEAAVAEFVEIVKEVVEDDIDFEVKSPPMPDLSEESKKKAIIQKTSARIYNRKGSDVGDDEAGDDNFLGQAVLVTNKMKNRAKQVLNVVSGIPILSEYTSELKEQWSLLVKEMPKELISARSLFQPYSICSFTMYRTDELSILKVCIEWKLGIPYDSIELFTSSGVPMTDTYTLLKEKQCVFADARMTRRFFEKEGKLKEEMKSITEEPLVYHNMALHGMTTEYMKRTFGGMKEKMAQEIIQGDLGVSGVIALKIIELIKRACLINACSFLPCSIIAVSYTHLTLPTTPYV